MGVEAITTAEADAARASFRGVAEQIYPCVGVDVESLINRKYGLSSYDGKYQERNDFYYSKINSLPKFIAWLKV